MSELSELIASETRAAEAADNDPDAPLPTHIKVTRGHDRRRVLQVRLNEDEYEVLSKLAAEHDVPASTYARALLLQTVGH